MGKYEKLSRSILENIGGIENITNITHCITRLRIEVSDYGNVNVEGMQNLPESKGVVVKGSQIQVIVGLQVQDAYQEFLEVSGWKKAENEKLPQNGLEKEPEKQKKKFRGFQEIGYLCSNFIGPIFMNIIPAMIVGGLILAIKNLLVNYCGMDVSGGTANIMLAIFEAGYNFLPIYVGYSMAAQLKMQPIMGGFLGGLLVATRINGVEGLSFLGISIPAVTYTSTIFPILLGVAFMYYVDKVLKKIIPDVLILFAKPLLTMIIVVPVELIILGPFGTVVSNLIGNFCIWLTNTLGFLAHPILAMASPYLIMFGFDKALTPIAVNLLATKGYNSLTCIMGFCSNLAVGGATLAMATLSKGNAERKGMLSSFGVTALCGVTEPAFYGALISTPKALIGQAIGAGLAGLVGGLFKMRAFASGGCPGLLTLLLFVDQTGSLYYVYRAIILAIIAISASFIATRIILTRDLKKKANRGN